MYCDVMMWPSFLRSHGLGRSNKFGQIQQSTNDNYADIKLQCMHVTLIECNDSELITIKKHRHQRFV